MRIGAGKHRGRRLKAPHGWQVRPTGDRVREAIFDLLRHGTTARDIADICVADVFAGTGAFGLEALSRGAAHAVFIDSNPRAIETIRTNARMIEEQDRATALRRDATRPGAPPPPAIGGCQLIFFDPPYDKGLLEPALSAFARAGWLAPGAIAVAEASDRESINPPDQFSLLKERRYGDTRILIYGWEGGR